MLGQVAFGAPLPVQLRFAGRDSKPPTPPPSPDSHLSDAFGTSRPRCRQLAEALRAANNTDAQRTTAQAFLRLLLDSPNPEPLAQQVLQQFGEALGQAPLTEVFAGIQVLNHELGHLGDEHLPLLTLMHALTQHDPPPLERQLHPHLIQVLLSQQDAPALARTVLKALANPPNEPSSGSLMLRIHQVLQQEHGLELPFIQQGIAALDALPPQAALSLLVEGLSLGGKADIPMLSNPLLTAKILGRIETAARTRVQTQSEPFIQRRAQQLDEAPNILRAQWQKKHEAGLALEVLEQLRTRAIEAPDELLAGLFEKLERVNPHRVQYRGKHLPKVYDGPRFQPAWENRYVAFMLAHNTQPDYGLSVLSHHSGDTQPGQWAQQRIVELLRGQLFLWSVAETAQPLEAVDTLAEAIIIALKDPQGANSKFYREIQDTVFGYVGLQNEPVPPQEGPSTWKPPSDKIPTAHLARLLVEQLPRKASRHALVTLPDSLLSPLLAKASLYHPPLPEEAPPPERVQPKKRPPAQDSSTRHSRYSSPEHRRVPPKKVSLWDLIKRRFLFP